MTGYKKIGSFEGERIDAVGVGDRAVTVGSGQQLTLVSGTDRFAFEHDDTVTDIALGNRIAVLSSNRLVAYTRDGNRVWTRTFDSPHAVTTLPGGKLAGILEPTRLRTLEMDTGQEQFTVERRRPGQPRDDQFIGTDHGFVSATWSFLRCVDSSGAEVFDYNLNTAIRDVGCCDGILVAALQNGQLRGIDMQTSERCWQTELPVRQVAPSGEGELLLSTGDGIKSIEPEGTIDSVSSLTDGNIYTARDGSVICSVRSGTVVTHVPSESVLDIDIATDSAGVGGTVDVEATNVGDAEHDVTLEADLAHADLAPSERQIQVSPRESRLTDFPIESVRTDGEAIFTVRVDGRVVAQRPIEIADAAESTVAAEADLYPIEISDGVTELGLTVENTGSVPLDSVILLETDEQAEDLTPDDTWTRTITKPYEPGRTITVGMEVVRGNRRTELAPTCHLPDSPSIELEQERDALHGRIDADDRVTWSDELVIEAPGADRVRSPVEIENGTLLVVVPVYEDGIARIGLSELGITDQARMGERGPLADLSGRTTRDTARGGITDRGYSPTSPSGSGISEGSTDRPSRNRETGLASASDSRNETPEDTSHTDTVGPTVSIERQVSDSRVAVGQAVRERLTVRNDGNDTIEPTVVVSDGHLSLGDLAAGETSTIQRIVAPFSTEAIQLPEAAVRTEDRVADRTPAKRVTVTDTSIGIRSVVDPADGRYELALDNKCTDTYRVDAVEFGGQQIERDTHVLAAGERTVLTGSLQSPPDRDRAAIEGTLSVTNSNREQESIDIVAVVRELSDSGTDDPFEKTIGPSTKVAGEYGTVVLVFENMATERLSDVTLKAKGDPINEMLYSRAHREELPPGERVEHYVDLKTGVENVGFDITVTYALGGTEQSHTYRVSGPAVDTESEWTDDHRASWELESGGDGTDGSTEFPSRVSTRYREMR